MIRHKVLVGSPVCRTPAMLAVFLRSLKGLRREGMQLDYMFVDDNTDPASSQLLAAFARDGSAVTVLAGTGRSDYVCDAQTHHWDDSLMLRVARYKNTIIQSALDGGYDALFFADSDLVMHPDLVRHLQSRHQEIVSEIFWTQWHEGMELEPNVWLFDEYDLAPKQLGEEISAAEAQTRRADFLAQLRLPGLYAVGGLGACTLLARSALEHGVHFAPIPNLTIHGEDRFFCIRAAVLGIPLFADTAYPAYHIYREDDLAGVPAYEAQCAAQPIRSRITLSMIVKNEAHRYLERVLRSVAGHIDAAVIIDDASTDNTVALCKELLQGIPVHIVTNDATMFANEVNLRKLQWEETVRTNPDWILNLDADECIEDSFWSAAQDVLSDPDAARCCFRLHDMWNETQYRTDAFWRAHETSRTFMVRYRHAFAYEWKETPQHCGRFPSNCNKFQKAEAAYRVQHFGWSTAQDRLEKHARYLRLDPHALYGIKAQYDSILDDAPTLADWHSHEH